MLQHGIDTLVTISVTDFTGFDQHVTLIALPGLS